MNTASLTLQDYWGIAVRRKWLILTAIVLCLGVAAVLCKVLPKVYRSSTLILVENQKIPERYVQGVVSGTVQERLISIKQQIMSRTVLGSIIKGIGLHNEDGSEQPLETTIERMRSDIRVDMRGGGR